MNTLLPKDWLTSTGIDRELHRYMLLSFAQRVGARFQERKLYPYLHEVKDHSGDLNALLGDLAAAKALSRDVTGVDLERSRIVYKEAGDDEWLAAIADTIDFALPRLKELLEEGDGLRRELEARIRFEPVGVLPLHTREGYLLLREAQEARVYAYAVPLYQEMKDDLRYMSVNTRYVASYAVSLACNYEHIKADLVRSARHLPNPATFVFESELPIPRVETYLPLAKQLVLAHVLDPAA